MYIFINDWYATAIANMYKDDLNGLVFKFYHVAPRDGSQVVRFAASGFTH